MQDQFGLTRRSLMTAACGLATVSLARKAFADAGLLSRPIPHGAGERLPSIGIGTSRVFDVGEDQDKIKQLTAVVEALAKGGGCLVDTASSYGSAEATIGAIDEHAAFRTKLFLATKLEARGGKAAEDEFADSLKRLRTERVDLLQLHNVRDGDPGLAFFREMQKAGKTRFVGATTTFKDAYGAMEALIRRDRPDFIEIDCSIANRDAEDRIIPAAADVGAAVLIALPFGRSSLFKKVKGKPLPPVAKEIDATTWGQVFLKYLLGNPAITAVIPGTDSVAHIEDNLGAGRGPMPDARQRQALVAYFEGLG